MTKELENISWKQHAVGFGVFIYVLNAFIIPYFSNQEITTKSVIYLIPVCILAGYGFGRFKKWRKEKNS